MNQLKGYKTSRDYKRLAELAKKQSVICIVTMIDGRKFTATTRYTEDSGYPIAISSPGHEILSARNADDFAIFCERCNVEFIEPEEVK